MTATRVATFLQRVWQLKDEQPCDFPSASFRTATDSLSSNHCARLQAAGLTPKGEVSVMAENSLFSRTVNGAGWPRAAVAGLPLNLV